MTYFDPRHPAQNLWRHRRLLWQFSKRQVAALYKGSYLGLVWSFTLPLAMLMVYTFVFSVVFKARWGDAGETSSSAEFALTLFAGLIVFNIFGETLQRSAKEIISHENLVKRVIFPLEILPVSLLGAALFNGAISLLILHIGQLWVWQSVPWTVVLLPFVLLPLILLSLGLGWLVAALGVFARDIGHALTLILQMLFFLTPIFYPVTAIPTPYRYVITYLNPLTFIVTQFRQVVLWGELPSMVDYLLICGLSGCVCLIGYSFFMSTKSLFADVV